ncbi:hypothetical protein TrRE_jg4384, partial [Triparma retinervis]
MDAYTNHKHNRKRLFALCQGEFFGLSAAFVSFFVSTYANASLPSMLGKLLDSSSKSSTPDNKLRMKAGVIFLLGGLGSMIRTLCLGRIEGRLRGSLMKKVMEATLSKDVETIKQHVAVVEEEEKGKEKGKNGKDSNPPTTPNTPSPSYILSTSIPSTTKTLTSTLPSFVRSLSGTFNSTYMLLSLSPGLTLYAGILVPTVGVGSVILSKFKSKQRKKREALEQLAEEIAAERIANVKLVKSSGTEASELAVYRSSVDACTAVATSQSLADGVFLGFLFTATALTLSTVLSKGGALVREGRMTQGDLTSYATYTFLLGAGAAGVTKARGEFKDGVAASGAVWRAIDEGGEVGGGAEVGGEVEDGRIEVEGLTYAYPGGDGRKVLDGMDLKVERGEVVGLVGKNGSGKSTVAMILKGLYHRGIQGGSVKVGGKEVGGGRGAKGVNVVMQEVGFVDGTVMENVLYGRQGEFGEDECRRVLSVVKGDDFVAQEGGMTKRVGINGCRLSGGQRQRVGLARGLVGRPKVLVLDEPDTYLDKDSGDIVRGCVERAREEGTTVVLISHDVDTVGMCDRVVGIEGGKVVYDGDAKGTLNILDKNGDGKIDAGEIAEAAAEAAKGTIERATGVAEKSVRQVTGDESYKFGDYTNRFLSEGDKALNKIRDEAFSQIPKQVWGEVLGDLTEQQREAFAISLIQLAATAVLAFNLSMNFVLSFTWMRAWKVVVSTTNLSPLSSPSHWSSLIARRASVEALISPLSLPLAAFCTLFILLPYKDLVEALERRMPLKRRFPIMNRVLTLAVACAAVNIGLVATAT